MAAAEGGAAGGWCAEVLAMLRAVQAEALRLICNDFEAVARTQPFIALCGGSGWQEHIVADEIAPALRRATKPEDRQGLRAVVRRLARGVAQDGEPHATCTGLLLSRRVSPPDC